MYWTPAKMLLQADVDEYDFTNAENVFARTSSYHQPLPEPILVYHEQDINQTTMFA